MSYQKEQPYSIPAGGVPPVNYQPQAMQTMRISPGGNRNALNKEVGSDGTREWSHGLCGCFGDCGTCCLAFWCPCIVYGQNKQRIRHLQQNGTPHPDGGDLCGGDCFLHGVLSVFAGVGCILQIGARSDTRSRYNIRGGTCSDFWVPCCCNICDLVQESREIQLEEQSFGPR